MLNHHPEGTALWSLVRGVLHARDTSTARNRGVVGVRAGDSEDALARAISAAVRTGIREDAVILEARRVWPAAPLESGDPSPGTEGGAKRTLRYRDRRETLTPAYAAIVEDIMSRARRSVRNRNSSKKTLTKKQWENLRTQTGSLSDIFEASGKGPKKRHASSYTVALAPAVDIREVTLE